MKTRSLRSWLDPEMSTSKIEKVHGRIDNLKGVSPRFFKAKSLFLSHNLISNLDGIEDFKNLESVSLSFNHIQEYSELLKIPNRASIRRLNIAFNPLTKNPNYRRKILLAFPHLESLDDLVVDEDVRRCHESIYMLASKRIIPFLVFLDEDFLGLSTLNQVIQRHIELGSVLKAPLEFLIEK